MLRRASSQYTVRSWLLIKTTRISYMSYRTVQIVSERYPSVKDNHKGRLEPRQYRHNPNIQDFSSISDQELALL